MTFFSCFELFLERFFYIINYWKVCFLKKCHVTGGRECTGVTKWHMGQEGSKIGWKVSRIIWMAFFKAKPFYNDEKNNFAIKRCSFLELQMIKMFTCSSTSFAALTLFTVSVNLKQVFIKCFYTSNFRSMIVVFTL